MSTPIKDMTGIKIGALTPIKTRKFRGKTRWFCRCDCGNSCYRKGGDLRNASKALSFSTCGCSSIFWNGENRVLVGIKTALLSILKYDKKKKLYLCLNRFQQQEWLNSIKIKNRLSRAEDYEKKFKEKEACAKKFNFVSYDEYSKVASYLLTELRQIRNRCYYKKQDNYSYYGGKGIKVCQEWLDNSMSFVHWSMQNGFKKGLQIDRIDSNGDYSPTNCRWVTKIVNANNTSKNVYYTIGNKTQSLAQWCREYNLNYKKTHSLTKYKKIPLEQIIKESKN